MPEQFKREVIFLPAFDRRHTDPNKNYGIHGVDLRFHLIGEQGATHLVIYTNWQLPEVQRELDAKPMDRPYPHLSCHPQPADLGYHRLARLDDWETEREGCDLLGGQTCYGDGSVLQATEVFEQFLREGDAAVWRILEDRYRIWVLKEVDRSRTT